MDFGLFSSMLEGLPEKVALDFEFPDVSEMIPSEPNLLSSIKYLAVFAGVFILLGLIGRIFLGRRSSLNHAISSAIGILMIYAVTAALYTLRPWALDELISPLPFVAFSGEYLRIFPMTGAHFSVICYEVLAMLILAFLMNLFDTLLPKGKGILGWYLLRFLSVALAMISHILVRWLFETYLPDALVLYAPMIILGVLAVFLLLGILNFVLSLVLTGVNPILGAAYTFFFSNLVGKQLTKAILTTAVLTVLVFLLEHLGIGLICIAEAALLSYLPVILILLVLWYLIGHIL